MLVCVLLVMMRVAVLIDMMLISRVSDGTGVGFLYVYVEIWNFYERS